MTQLIKEGSKKSLDSLYSELKQEAINSEQPGPSGPERIQAAIEKDRGGPVVPPVQGWA